MIVTLLIKRLLASVFTFPTPGNVKNVAAGALVCGGVLAAGVKSGVYKWQPIRDTRALGWAASYMLMRALLEEVVFRAAMLPHPKADETKWLGSFRFMIASVIPGLLFVVSHSLTTQREGETVMNDTIFLGTVSFVGAICSWAYWVTSGGLWAAVAMHFLAVFPWMVLLGGYRKTHTPHPMKVGGAGDLAPSGPLSGANGIKQE